MVNNGPQWTKVVPGRGRGEGGKEKKKSAE